MIDPYAIEITELSGNLDQLRARKSAECHDSNLFTIGHFLFQRLDGHVRVNYRIQARGRQANRLAKRYVEGRLSV